MCPSEVVVDAGSRAEIINEGIRVAFLTISGLAIFIGKVLEQLMHLAKVFSLREWCILNDRAPAVRVA